ncbi:MAG: precorrin-3B C(17)-methyltransferase [Gammaproteobacteria bacterium]|nr:precorrin-3B C(17)-methyltransferase [Gammaproteobacteria bacterium]
MTNAAPTNGKIFLVGLGPGDVVHMTARARQAIAESDTVIGYSTYIKLVKDLLDDKEVIRKGMTEELDRCYEALERARQGKTVALVSSGDSGVYGMAGPTFEVLFESGWKPGEDVDVEVVPGSSAINACAALVGAPLTHDACTISLSDLLTPWPVIARRLEAAAKADFVLALYNPKSGRRTGQIVEAQRLLLLHRSPDTPVALVKSAYRRRQHIELTRLERMADSDIGMLTTVIVGNSNTFVRDGLMVTPRGYANKYSMADSGLVVKDGEQSGRSLSMGLIGWRALAAAWLAEDEKRTLLDAASRFDMPFAEILAAVSLHGEESGCSWQASAVDVEDFTKAFNWARSWNRLRVIVRSEAGSVVELLLTDPDFQFKGNWLNLISDSAHLHVPWNKVMSIWVVAHHGTVQGLYCCDARGGRLLNMQPIAATIAFDPVATAHLFRFSAIQCETEQEEASADVD